MRRFAIFLSSEKYTNYSNTDYCHADSDLLKDILIDRCDYPKENILQIKLNPGDDNDPSTIIEKINSLVQRSDVGDTILFFYAGHGQAVNGESYLILPDTKNFDVTTSSLSLRDVHHYLSENQRINVRIFDCCHSGANVRGAAPELNSGDFIKAILTDGGDGTITFSSCAINEKSYPDEDAKQGVFTFALVNAIARIPANSPVFVETLKLDVCTQVQKWSEDNGKTQTPTLTMHMNGNMPIAHTKQTEQLKPDVVIVSDAPFLERLANARSTEVITEKFYRVLTEAINTLASEAERESQGFDYYGLGLKVKPPSSCNSIPEELEKRIVLSMKDEATMHSMEVVRKKRLGYDMMFPGSSLFKPPPEYDIFYNLSQSPDAPDSYFEMKLESDGVAPDSSIFIYICPLQTTVVIISGYYFDVGYNSAKRLKVVVEPRKVYLAKTFRDKVYTNLVAPLIRSFEDALHLEMIERLHALEKEAARVNVAP